MATCSCGSRKSPEAKRCRACASFVHRQKHNRSCEGCGILFIKSRNGGSRKNAGRFHSRACAYEFYHRRSVERQAGNKAKAHIEAERKQQELDAARMARMRPCEKCAELVRPPTRFCSRACMRGSKYILVYHRLVCSVCAGEYLSRRKRSGRCHPCQRRHLKRIARKRYGNKHCKRAKIKGAPRDYGVGPVKVFERDGWRCRICGKSTPKRLQGKQLPDSPTVDHIVPFAFGGGHTWDNVQLACHACNMAKGATVLGQPRLGLLKSDDATGGWAQPIVSSA